MLEHGFAGTAASLAQRFAGEKAELIQADIETSGPATEAGGCAMQLAVDDRNVIREQAGRTFEDSAQVLAHISRPQFEPRE
jgi:hypothetical protein